MVPEIASRCVQLLERWAEPLRLELCRRLERIGRRLASKPDNTAGDAALPIKQQKLKADQHRLFLGRSMSHGGGCLCLSQWNKYMRRFAEYVGVDWPLDCYPEGPRLHAIGQPHDQRHWARRAWTFTISTVATTDPPHPSLTIAHHTPLPGVPGGDAFRLSSSSATVHSQEWGLIEARQLRAGL
jgi:hypothetical protein